jgi:hypothetical protein
VLHTGLIALQQQQQQTENTATFFLTLLTGSGCICSENLSPFFLLSVCLSASLFLASRVARFFLAQHTKTGKIHQKTINYTKWPQKYHIATKIPNGHKNTKWPSGKPNGHKIYQHLPFEDRIKFTQVGIFGLKIYHLATLYLLSMQRE